MRHLTFLTVAICSVPALSLGCTGSHKSPSGAASASASSAAAGSASSGEIAGSPGTGGSAGSGVAPSSTVAGGPSMEAAGGSTSSSAAAGGPSDVAGASGAETSGGGAGTGAVTTDCTFSVSAQTADQAGPGGIPTVGIVNWSVDLAKLESARLVFGPNGGTTTTNVAVDVSGGPKFRTLLLGMKASKTYSFHFEVSDGASSCASPDYSITTGALPSGAPSVTRTGGPAESSQDKGFIVTSSGMGSFGGGMGGGVPGGGTSAGAGTYAFIVDADGDVVWLAPAPSACSRAKMSPDGQFMWMVALNGNTSTQDGGEVRRVSIDGLTSTENVPGLANCHHDITVLPDGRVACPSWVRQSGDQPSDLLEGDVNGNVERVVTLDSQVYLSGSDMGGRYHANAIHYHPSDDSYTVGDRDPNLFVKLSHQGKVLWQFGGSCSGAPAPECVPGDWSVNHGHDLLDDGTFPFFNNGSTGGGSQSGAAVLFYALTEGGTLEAEKTGSYAPGVSSPVLGDVQRLPNGNTLVAFSSAAEIHEIDRTGTLVQKLDGPGGYADWRETLYGPPSRF